MPPESPAVGLHAALARNTGYLLSRLGTLAQRHFSERLGSLGLTPRLWGALNVVEAESPLSQQELGQLIGMDPSSMVSTIDELERSGLVERQPHPSDRRAHALHITDAGRDTLVLGRELARGAQSELLSPLSAQERRVLHDLLLRVAEGTDARIGPVKKARSPSDER